MARAGCIKSFVSGHDLSCFVSGHDLSRAVEGCVNRGLQPLRDDVCCADRMDATSSRASISPVIGHRNDGPRPKLPLLLSVCVELRPKSAQSKHATLCHNSAPSSLQSVRDAARFIPRRGTPPYPPIFIFSTDSLRSISRSALKSSRWLADLLACRLQARRYRNAGALRRSPHRQSHPDRQSRRLRAGSAH